MTPVRDELTQIKGIGRWTADIYLMEALLRPDIWPAGDLALAIAVQRVKNLAAEVPNPAVFQDLGGPTAPGGQSPRACSGTTTSVARLSAGLK